MNRNLDGCYFRVKRNDGFEPVCFSDLTVEERNAILDGRSEEWLKNLCCYLADVIKDIGEQFGIEGR